MTKQDFRRLQERGDPMTSDPIASARAWLEFCIRQYGFARREGGSSALRMEAALAAANRLLADLEAAERERTSWQVKAATNYEQWQSALEAWDEEHRKVNAKDAALEPFAACLRQAEELEEAHSEVSLELWAEWSDKNPPKTGEKRLGTFAVGDFRRAAEAKEDM